jgi:hypothetical protein
METLAITAPEWILLFFIVLIAISDFVLLITNLDGTAKPIWLKKGMAGYG